MTDLTKLAQLAEQHSSSYASPHHFVLSVTGLRSIIEAALRDAPQAEGWVMVPVEPTWDMQMAASSNYREPRDGHYTARMECAADAYRAMLSARPSAPTAVEPDERDTERMNWIAVHGSFGVDSVTNMPGGNGQKRIAATREAIDAASASKGTPQ